MRHFTLFSDEFNDANSSKMTTSPKNLLRTKSRLMHEDQVTTTVTATEQEGYLMNHDNDHKDMAWRKSVRPDAS
jgi:hypothetical protein